MKKILITFFVAMFYLSASSQDFNTMTGDWIRIKGEYQDGDQLENNNTARAIVRYRFTKKEVFVIFPGNTQPVSYNRTGNRIAIGPVQKFVIEEYTKSALTLVDAEGAKPIRYYMVPTDSFQIKRKYAFEAIGQDTIYTEGPGIEPIYLKGHNEFMQSLMGGFSQTVGFHFSYIVEKDGSIGDVVVTVSSNPKQDKRLVQLVKKSSGKWIPATYKGKPINVRLNARMSFN
jgi:hypothetical protein